MNRKKGPALLRLSRAAQRRARNKTMRDSAKTHVRGGVTYRLWLEEIEDRNELNCLEGYIEQLVVEAEVGEMRAQARESEPEFNIDGDLMATAEHDGLLDMALENLRDHAESQLRAARGALSVIGELDRHRSEGRAAEIAAKERGKPCV